MHEVGMCNLNSSLHAHVLCAKLKVESFFTRSCTGFATTGTFQTNDSSLKVYISKKMFGYMLENRDDKAPSRRSEPAYFLTISNTF